MSQERQKLFSLAAVVVAAVLFGMVIAGGLNLTPRADADRPQAVAASPGPVSVPAAVPDFADLAELVNPSVVSVYAKDVVSPEERRRSMPQDPFHRFFGPFSGREEDQEPVVRRSSGSGFFVSAGGEVLTNNHVVEDADELEIELSDGQRYSVEVVGSDPATDLALVRVVDPDREFPYLALGDSEALRAGEWVMAVGNPLNMAHSVTVGVVSAKGRFLGLSEASSSFENFIQTDAAINFGNSGGPLVNLRGEAVGINTAINIRGQNLGFAVPADAARLVLAQLREHGEVVRGYLGVVIRNITQEIEGAFDLESRDGAFVEEVMPGHAADKAGLEHGDVIVSIDGQPVKDNRELIDRISATPPGTRVELGVVRDGEIITLSVELERREEVAEDGVPSDLEDAGDDVLERVGITVTELTPRMLRHYGLDEDLAGVFITRVRAVSPAADAGLRRGDVVLEAGGAEIDAVDQLVAEVEKVEPGGYLRLYFHRPQNGRSSYAIVPLD